MPGGSFCHLLRRHDRAPRSEGFLLEGVANFLMKGGRKTPLAVALSPKLAHATELGKGTPSPGNKAGCKGSIWKGLDASQGIYLEKGSGCSCFFSPGPSFGFRNLFSDSL